MIQKTKEEYLKEHKNWGSIKIINFPEKSERLAELVGIILGDGNLHAYKKGKDVGTYSLRIAGNYIKDYEYLTNYVANLCKDLFMVKPRTYKQPNVNCIYLIIDGRLIVDFLIEIGLKHGNKIKSQVTIQNWIKENDAYLKACIRGLIDTDGCIYEMLPHWPGLFQINFENRNITLLRDTREALINLGYHPSKICGKRTVFGTKIYISRKEEIKRFYKEIWSSNDRNIKQFTKVFNS
ncbi:hypothetical protein J4234_01740 [Candidatus Woesearchaeota archaeon]|nr:hypothetical protein [Candidatus Woesearchaeota archaeon]